MPTTFSGSAATDRIPGGTAVTLATLWNPVGSGVTVNVRAVFGVKTDTSNSATPRNMQAARITSAPSGGTVMTPAPFDSAVNTVAAEFRGAAAGDGTLAAITATATDRVWGQIQRHIYGTPAEQQEASQDDLIPKLAKGTPIVLAEGEGIGIFLDTTSSVAHFAVSAVWEEETPTPPPPSSTLQPRRSLMGVGY